MAEGGGLLNRYTLLRRIEGSNSSVSARLMTSAVVCPCPQKSRDNKCFLTSGVCTRPPKSARIGRSNMGRNMGRRPGGQ